jgi:hypothetical protein
MRGEEKRCDEDQDSSNRTGDDRGHAAGLHVTDYAADNREDAEDDEVEFGCADHGRSVRLLTYDVERGLTKGRACHPEAAEGRRGTSPTRR